MKTETRRATIADIIREKNETVYLTIGFRWKHPTTMDHPMTPQQAIEWLETGAKHYAMVEAEERESDGAILLNAYTANDMW